MKNCLAILALALLLLAPIPSRGDSGSNGASANPPAELGAGQQDSTKKPPVSDIFPAVTPEAFNKGAKLFRKKTCNGCHAIGRFFDKCPDLKGVTKRHSASWLRRWLADPDEMRKTDETARKLSEEYAEVMPFLDLQPEEIEPLLVYLLQGGIDPESGEKR